MIGPVPLTDKHRQQIEEFRVRHRTGVLTLLFTDMVESTRLKQELGDAMGSQLIRQQQNTVRAVLVRYPDAQEISTAGDSFFIVFSRPSDAVRFALHLHAELRTVFHETPRPIMVRIGIHMGEVFIQEKQDAGGMDVLGIQVDTASRVMSLASGGQTLMTRSVFDNSRTVLRGEEFAGLAEIAWLEHGAYRFKGVDHPYGICETGEAGYASLTPPADSEKAHRVVSADQEPVLGWRPAVDQEIPTAPGWTLVEKLGEGGFGEVWKARHKTLKEARVFKFCFRADRVRSLKREVTLFRLLKQQIGEHPNIVRIYDVFFDEPPYYIVMETVDGRDLSHWWQDRQGRDRLPQQTRLEIVAQVADALQAAHDAGIIHRDIKPSNILVSQKHNVEVQVKLTDFGIGQVVDPGILDGKTKAGFTETFLGTEMTSRSGTHLYMAPELVAGQPASTRSDIYSLGVVLYQLVTGDLTRSLAPDWRKDVHDPLLADIMAPCFAGNPTERYAGASELGKKLRRIEEIRADLQESQRHAEAAAARKRTLRFLYTATAIFLAVAALLLWGLKRENMQRAVAEENRSRAEYLMTYMLYDLRDKLMEIGRLDLLEGVARKSMEYYASLPQTGEYAVAAPKRATTLINIGDVFLQQGRPGEALSAYERARDILKGLVDAAPGDLTAHGNLYMVHYRIAQAQLFADRHDEAFASFDTAVGIVEEMQTMSPDDPTILHQLTSILTYYSEALWGEGRFADSQKAIERALDLAETLHAKDPGNAAWSRSLMFVQRQLGALALDRGKLSLALEHFHKAEEITGQLLATNPENTEWTQDFVYTRGRTAEVLSVEGRTTQALAEQAEAHEIIMRLSNQDPLNVVWKNALLASHRLRGNLQLARWNVDEASQSLTSALAIADELLRHATDNATFLSQAAGVRLRLARVYVGRNQVDAALREGTAGQETLQALVERNPGRLTQQWKEASAALDVADMLVRKDELDAAMAQVQHAITVLGKVRESFPEHAFIRQEESSAYRNRAEIERRRGQWDKALADFDQARTIAEELVGLDPDNALFLNQRARVDVGAARTELLAGKKDEAREHLLAALNRTRPLALRCDDPGVLDTLSQAMLLLDETREAKPTVERLLAMGWNDPNFLEICKQTGMLQ